jgi:hypothetical protein
MPTGSNQNGLAKAAMVGWYDPRQLIRTGIDVAVSTIFGRNSDFRLLEALRNPITREFYDHSVECDIIKQDATDAVVEKTDRPRSEIWIDYIADVGDGWDSSYSVAYNVAQDLQLTAPDRSTHATRCGDLLIFGGDAVYPVASHANYTNKLIQAFEAARKESSSPHPFAYAIPGNHDWYDSLVSFSRLFCSGRWLAGWRTRQERSYFAVKLPRGWWLLGTDVQLASDIDEAQVEYFRNVAQRMQSDDRIILCNAEPHWIYAALYKGMDADYTENNLAYLEEKVLGRKVSVFLAGDLHHYRRHAEATGTVQKITCGGGGAFLHPTHKSGVEVITEEVSEHIKAKGKARTFVKAAAYPEEKTSARLCYRNLAFLFLNPWFGLLTGILYALCWWSFQPPLSYGPAPLMWILLTWVGFFLFTDTHSLLYRLFGGTLHATAHLVAAVGIGMLLAQALHATGEPPHLARLWGVAALTFVAGWVAGSIIMGVYLLISLNVFGRHSNEAFSSLAIKDYKSFLRMHINAAGELTIYPIAIDRVARKWQKVAGPATVPVYQPHDPKYTPSRLIESPVAVCGSIPCG